MIDESALADFGSAVRGTVLVPGDPAYDETRQVFNAMIEHRPVLIAKCVSAGDVIACRSEERRVGKECRSRWSTDPEKKNKKNSTSTSEVRDVVQMHRVCG